MLSRRNGRRDGEKPPTRRSVRHRERNVRWGPRTIDLDIVFYDDIVLDTEELHIPHIDMHNRSFVLIPLCSIAPYYRHPILNKTVEQLRKGML